ncbi:MAG: T9SS type A sorting domain-containing protein [Candidatus Krumholzibacteriota bacterium]|nr:T9SS type A sorting domain-containing protein [Candidatus Krumholzibacteriota bacterium]
MRTSIRALTLAALLGVLALPAAGQVTIREDAIWAKQASGPIQLDGVLDEADWALAEVRVLRWAENAGIPGSGWKVEGGDTPSDPTEATLRFLVYDNQLYLGAEVADASVGGSRDFNRHDGFLMSIKDHADPNFPKPMTEYFYAWWYPLQLETPPPGQEPAFIGRWAEWPPGTPRTPEQIAAWDAVTIVDGLSNDDGVLDTGYTVEMRFDLTVMGYDVTQPEGDIIEWNISVYDCDWLWPLDALQLSYNRVWWQCPWGYDDWFNEVRIYARPDVTVADEAPLLESELVLPVLNAEPVIDGVLDEDVWDDPGVYSFDIRYGDDALRMTYPGVGPYRAGQYQPEVNGSQAFVVDPGDANVKIFVNGDKMYFGFDVNDIVVQYHPVFDRWDGFMVNFNDRVSTGPDHQLLGRRLSFQVGEDGAAVPRDYLVGMVSIGDAEVAVDLKAGTSVDTLGTTPDTGYTAELSVDLTALGYPPGLGDRIVFFGINLLDGDSFTPYTFSYGTRTWWFRQYEGNCCATWAEIAKGTGVDDGGGDWADSGSGFLLLPGYPNPSPQPSVRFQMPEYGDVTLEVFDVLGRLVQSKRLGLRGLGVHRELLDLKGQSAGVYMYRITVEDPGTGKTRAALTGKTVLLR